MENRNLSNIVYEKILADIVELRIEPGAFVLERNISEGLGVSRTPVREAIKRLTQEGWLVAEDRKRPYVKGFTLEEGAALFQFRKMAEMFALNWAFENGMERFLAGRLDLQIRKMQEVAEDNVRFIRADVEFHTEIVRTMNNDYLTRAWHTVAEQIVRVAIYGMDQTRTVDKIVDEHEAMVQCIWGNKRDDAYNVLSLHHELIFAGIERKLIMYDSEFADEGRISS